MLIAGAGIGGLSAALCLDQDGHEVHVVEQAAELGETGAGIQCGANAMHVFTSLGLADAIAALAVDPECIEFREFDSGRTLHTLVLGQAYAERFGAPYLHIGRADLHGILAAALNQRAPAALQLNARVTAYQEMENSVSLQFADGGEIAGDCLIACDGIHSPIRQQMHGALAARWTGNVAWRGTLDASRLPQGFMPKVGYNFVGPGKHMVIYYLRQQQQLNFVGVVENQTWQDDSWVAKAPWEELKSDFAGWHDTVQGVIDAVDKDHCYRWALHKHHPVANWSTKRVTLLGDAAHASLPFMAAGAAMAVEDARVLQRAIAQCDTIDAALQLYQDMRIPRTRQVQRASNALGKIYHVPGKSLRGAAFKLVQTLGRGTQDGLANYNANTIALR